MLLRPVVESALLPTVAYLAGPGELRYLELAPPVYERLGVTRQLPVPRWSGLLVERRVDRVLESSGSALDDLLEPAGRWKPGSCGRSFPTEATAALAELRAAVEAQYEARPRRGGDRPDAGTAGQSARRQALTGAADSRRSWCST